MGLKYNQKVDGALVDASSLWPGLFLISPKCEINFFLKIKKSDLRNFQSPKVRKKGAK
jgi:hypothetical protein